MKIKIRQGVNNLIIPSLIGMVLLFLSFVATPSQAQSVDSLHSVWTGSDRFNFTLWQQYPHADTLIHEDSIRCLYSKPIDNQWVSYKAKVDIQADNIDKSCQLFFVNRFDSVIYLNFHVSGVEIIRVVLTPDNATVVNKLDQTYYTGGYGVCSKYLGIRADFRMIQAFFNGIDFADFEPNFVWDFSQFPKSVVFTSPLRPHRSLDWNIMQRVELNYETNVFQNEMTDLSSGKMLKLTYTTVDSTSLWYNTLTFELPIRHLNVTLNTKDVKINVPGPTSIKIPEKFARLNLSDE